ncbi:class I SAM-dependent methyltransferase [Mesorhizobium yinganensis]|uniref:class I SAM-dependent methyltransferase n=1 Tax=Mesorhizobium yinganensis TaxID=3157707 RepID=UPI0032B799DE
MKTARLPPIRSSLEVSGERFIREKMRVARVAGLAGIRLYTATPASGLWRLAKAGGQGRPPYWAYAWAGGLALARHVLDKPETVMGRRVLDLGAGSGLVGIAAAKAGAASVFSAETDAHARVAIGLNAVENGVAVELIEGDVLDDPPPAVDVVLAGDVFYDEAVAKPMLTFLDRCLAAGIYVLVGDPGRAPLPSHRLRAVAHYDVPDFGDGAARTPAWVFALEPHGVPGEAAENRR